MQSKRQSAAVLANLLVLGACGTKLAAPERTETISQTAPATYGQLVEQGATSMALHQLPAAGDAEIILTTHKGRTFMHPEGSPLAIATDFEAQLVDVQDDIVWLASTNALAKVEAESLVAEPAISLPRGTKASAIEIAFDGSVFVADAKANRIYWVQGDDAQVWVEGPELANPRALQLDGGRLIVGGTTGIYSLNLATGERSHLATSASPVVALALDHRGYLVFGDEAGTISLLRSGGEVEQLQSGPGSIVSLAFDEGSRSLYVATLQRTSKIDYLELSGEEAALWAQRDRRPMRALRKNNMIVSGAEYWPSRGTTKVQYPDDILWGFYPAPDQVQEGSAAKRAPTLAATQCAEKSYAALMDFVDSNPDAFHAAVSASGASNRFYLWVNDYSETSADFAHELRMNKFWYWQRDPAVKGRVPGFWKWETTLLRDGRCLWPEPAQIASYLQEKRDAPR